MTTVCAGTGGYGQNESCRTLTSTDYTMGHYITVGEPHWHSYSINFDNPLYSPPFN